MTNPQEKILSKLEKWVDKNNPAYLCWKLGYRDTQVINNWLKRRHVPFYMVNNLLGVLNEQGSNNSGEYVPFNERAG